ncbi:MAG: hypothetical protein WD691_11345 [Acidimicrobiales bacterium]
MGSALWPYLGQDPSSAAEPRIKELIDQAIALNACLSNNASVVRPPSAEICSGPPSAYQAATVPRRQVGMP